MQTNYTVDLDTNTYCSIAIQTIDNMDRVFDIDTERHFYFGDVFFKQFVGIFDMANGFMGMAKSRLASSSKVTFSCEGAWCTEPNEEEQASDEAPTPSVVPDPDPTPVDPADPEEGGDSDDDMFWIWIIIALGVLILIAAFLAIYYCMQSKRKDKWAAFQYENTPANDGDLIEKDVER